MSASIVISGIQNKLSLQRVDEELVEVNSAPSIERRALSRHYHSKSRSFSDISSIIQKHGKSAHALGKKRIKSVDEIEELAMTEENKNTQKHNNPNNTNGIVSLVKDTTLLLNEMRLKSQIIDAKRRVRRKVDSCLPLSKSEPNEGLEDVFIMKQDPNFLV